MNDWKIVKWLEKYPLLYQIFKFGVVGVICFFIDWLVGLLVMNIVKAIAGPDSFAMASVLGAIAGFIVSVIANYLLSFKFVFERKEDLSRGKEFVAFVVLSVIGMGINTFIIWFGDSVVYESVALLKNNVGESLMYTISKVVATAVVMVYNFVTRKIFLEKKD